MTLPNNVPQTDPPPVTTPPANTPPPEQPPAPQQPRPVVVNAPGTNDNSLLTAVNSLPEKIVDVFRSELASQQPPNPAPQTPQTPSTPPATTPAVDQAKGRRSVGEWFFGMPK